MNFLKKEYPECFGNSRVRAYGNPGIRQTRWIVGAHHLQVADVRAGKKFDDAIGRTAWAIEIHDKAEGIYWEPFDADHIHYVPFGSLIPMDGDNLIAAGRCIDGDTAALVDAFGRIPALYIADGHHRAQQRERAEEERSRCRL